MLNVSTFFTNLNNLSPDYEKKKNNTVILSLAMNRLIDSRYDELKTYESNTSAVPVKWHTS